VLEGWTVAQPLDFPLGDRKYVGGTAYQVVAAESDAILAALSDADQLPQALPLTHDAEQVPLASGHPSHWTAQEPPAPRAASPGSSLGWLEPTGPARPRRVAVELEQGSALFKARYTVQLTRTDENTLRFSLDSARHHDIRDARGFFTAHRLNATHSLVTVFVGVDLGGGLAHSLLKRPVQKAALAAPAHIRRYLEPLAKRERIARAAVAQERASRNQKALAAKH
jgi:hypothetical protein